MVGKKERNVALVIWRRKVTKMSFGEECKFHCV